MFTLHLSRFLKGSPNQAVQQLNAWVHQEPYDAVAYCLYWFFVLAVFVPIAATSLPFMLCFELGRRQFLKDSRTIQPRHHQAPSTTKIQLAVIVTGCDTGIGKELALCLASEGFVVFAGCLSKESFEHFNGLGSSSIIHPVVVDVTSDKQVQSCYQTVNEWLLENETGGDDDGNNATRYLHALVNNAGMGVAGYIDWLDLSDFELCMNGEFEDEYIEEEIPVTNVIILH
jgi:hypothetical protein